MGYTTWNGVTKVKRQYRQPHLQRTMT